ncbi:MAG: RNA pseudouridine synthase [Pseudorhodobacter sp.]|nr:RNA pseudouridine synthase [Rhizobacter sp.]
MTLDEVPKTLGTSALVYEDASLLVVCKPAGLLSVPGRGADKQDCVSAQVQATYGDALTVHRLDMATSGLMLFARGAEVQRLLSIAFEKRAIGKRYVAVVDGSVEVESGEINSPLLADWPNRPLQKVDAENGKPSLTRYSVLSRNPAAKNSRLLLEPVTGRSHQLRIHLRELGHPIWGDVLYAPPAVSHLSPRLLLHASSLSLIHPVSSQALQFDSAVPF